MHYALLKRFESSLDDKRKAIYDIVDTILLYSEKVKNYAMIAIIALNRPCTGRLTYSMVFKKYAITVL